MKLLSSVVGFLSCAVAIAGAGCDADDRCGNGTVEVDGACVPRGGGGECGPGTIEQDGECVPDGSVICETGTTFDAEAGVCIPDISGCAAGTVLIDGECVPEGEVRDPDVEEAAEPNDGLLANDSYAQFALRPEGESVLLHGCITPYRDVVDAEGGLTPDGEQDADNDAFVFEADGPTLLSISVDGVNGAAGGFQMLSTDDRLQNDGWTRFGIKLTGDTVQQQVFLPVAGTYVFLAADSRSLLTNHASGDADTCYYATVAREPIMWTPLDGAATATLGGDVQFWTYAPEADGEVIASSIDYTSESASAALVQLVNDEYRGSTAFTGRFGAPAGANLASLSADDEVQLVVEPITNFSISPVATELTVTRVPTTALPVDGSPVTLTHSDAAPFNLVWFQASAGDLVRLQFAGGGTPYDMAVYPPSTTSFVFEDGQALSDFCFAGSCASVDVWVQVQATGYYYFNVRNLAGVDGATYDVSIDLTTDTPTALAVDVPAPGSLVDQNRDFFEITLPDLTWLEYVVTPTGFTDARVRFYDRSAAGELEELVVPVDQDISSAGAPFGRIIDGTVGTLLVSVDDADVVDGDETFDVSFSARPFTDAGIVDDGSPVAIDDIPLAAGEPTLVFLRGGSSDNVRVTVADDGGADLVVEEIDRTEAALFVRDGGGGGAAETFARPVGADRFIAFRVSAAGGAAGSFDLDADVVDLTPTSGTSAPAVPIPDDDVGGIDDTITLADACTVAAVTVDVNVAHTFRGDVVLQLTSPSGTTVLLKDAAIDDPDDDVIGQFPTTLEPAESLDAFVGEDAVGGWTLNAADSAFLDVGTLNSWGVNLLCM